jgi:phospholipid/cholesterol/gamma-HCH transport system substrate-binding protein
VSLLHQLRRYRIELAAVVALIVIAIPVGAYILVNQRLRFPWENTYRIDAEFSSAQAVTPGQGQDVNVAGVKVGEITAVELHNGRARVSMEINADDLPHVYSNAHMLLRPKTGLNDMSIQMDPGDPPGRKLADGATLPLANTQPVVNPDEVLAGLDADTRPYLATVANEGGRALHGRAPDLRTILKAAEPTLAQTERVTNAINGRRVELRRLIHNLRELTEATAAKDVQLTRLVDAADTTFATLGARESDLRAALRRLPGVLASTQGALASGQRAATELEPALSALRPAVRKLPGVLTDVRPLLREGTPILRDQLRPLVHKAVPLVDDLRPTLGNLNAVTPDLDGAFAVLNYVVNELAYNPPGSEEGYLFWTAWFFHNANSLLSLQDSQGAVWRGQVILSCSSVQKAKDLEPILQLMFALPACPADASVGSK